MTEQQEVARNVFIGKVKVLCGETGWPKHEDCANRVLDRHLESFARDWKELSGLEEELSSVNYRIKALQERKEEINDKIRTAQKKVNSYLDEFGMEVGKKKFLNKHLLLSAPNSTTQDAKDGKEYKVLTVQHIESLTSDGKDPYSEKCYVSGKLYAFSQDVVGITVVKKIRLDCHNFVDVLTDEDFLARTEKVRMAMADNAQNVFGSMGKPETNKSDDYKADVVELDDEPVDVVELDKEADEHDER
jgi:hypothetical protein